MTTAAVLEMNGRAGPGVPVRRAVSEPAAMKYAFAGPAVAAPAAVTRRCGICFDDVEAGAAVSQLCGREECDAAFCANCVSLYITVAFGRVPKPYCAMLRCPGCSNPVPSERWGPHATEASRTAFRRSAESMLSLQCGGCHNRRTLFPQPGGAKPSALLLPNLVADEKDVADGLERHLRGDRGGTSDLLDGLARLEADLAAASLEGVEGLESFRGGAELRALVQRTADAQREFDTWAATDPAYTELLSRVQAARRGFRNYPRRERGELMRAAVRMAAPVRKRLRLDKMRMQLKAAGLLAKNNRGSKTVRFGLGLLGNVVALANARIACPERRAVLILAQLRRTPTVRTPCCSKHHCFICKVRGTHEDPAACRAYNESRGVEAVLRDVRYCVNEACRVPLVKTEGCASVTCPACGTRFGFNDAPREAFG